MRRLTGFAEKNRRRWNARHKDPKAYTKARAARRQYGNRGAFGSWAKDSREWQLCATGRVTSVEAGD